MPDEKGMKKPILVVGGGMAGITAAVEAAEVGHSVILLEKNPYLGGRVAQMYHYFPKLCPPSCGLEINFRRIRQNPRIGVYTMAEVTRIEGEEGSFKVDVTVHPRYVNEKCTCCGKCVEACGLEVPNPFNYGLNTIKAAHLPHSQAFPMRYVLAPQILGTEDAQKCKDACEYDAIDLEMAPKTMTLEVGAVVWATGWAPFDASKVTYYNANVLPDVISNVQMERLADPNGPTGGKILRPSDGKPAKNVAFVQCAGSRDENFLPYCSGVCCLASLKQATYVREKDPEAKVTIYFIDIRAKDRLEDFYTRVQGDDKVSFVKAKVGTITKDQATGMLAFEGEDSLTGQRYNGQADLVVLATGIVPDTAAKPIPCEGIVYDEYGFVAQTIPGIFAAGTVTRPTEVSLCVQDGTNAALRAIQALRKG